MTVASVVLLLTALLSVGTANRDTSRTLDIINHSGHRVQIFWINRWKNDELVLNTEEPLLHGADSRINSYVSHEFEIQEMPHKKTNQCSGEDGKCLTAQFQVNNNHGQTITIQPGLVLELEDDKKRAQKQANTVVQECKSKFADRSGEDPYKVLEEMTACIMNTVNTTLEEKQDEIDFQAQVRSKLGERLKVYACSDVNATTSESIENTTWAFERKKYNVKVLLERPTSKIQLIENFVTNEECLAAENAINTEKVNDNGLTAKKGGVVFPNDESLLSKMAGRIYTYVEEALDADLEVNDREELFMIHYVGNEKKPAQYEPHCDGKCDGSDVEEGDRIATVIIYCEVPSDKEGGGATHFPNSGTHVKPKVGDALFISYVDPKTGIMDTGLTNHSGCPVTSGNKKILTHKLRLAK
jgi:hypothetical protein